MVTIEDSAHLYIVPMCAVASQQKRKKENTKDKYSPRYAAVLLEESKKRG